MKEVQVSKHGVLQKDVGAWRFALEVPLTEHWCIHSEMQCDVDGSGPVYIRCPHGKDDVRCSSGTGEEGRDGQGDSGRIPSRVPLGQSENCRLLLPQHHPQTIFKHPAIPLPSVACRHFISDLYLEDFNEKGISPELQLTSPKQKKAQSNMSYSYFPGKFHRKTASSAMVENSTILSS